MTPTANPSASNPPLPEGISIERLEQAKDARLWRFLKLALDFLAKSGLAWAAFGSCAVFAHRGCVRRLTRDLDLLLPGEDFEKLSAIAQGAGFETVRERESFIRIRHDIYQIHAVPQTYTLFDYRDGQFLAALHAPVDWSKVAQRELRFPIDLPALPLLVAPLETVACVSMMRPLNANSLDDLRGLLADPALDPAGIWRFVDANPALRHLVIAQLETLARLEREGRFTPASSVDFDRNLARLRQELACPA